MTVENALRQKTTIVRIGIKRLPHIWAAELDALGEAMIALRTVTMNESGVDMKAHIRRDITNRVSVSPISVFISAISSSSMHDSESPDSLNRLLFSFASVGVGWTHGFNGLPVCVLMER